jgi:hypothetical protein
MLTRSLIALCVAVLASNALAGAPRPVVVELFTSQGCSSCPPADHFLSELGDTREDVLPLAFHVTYWNQLGWRDPFSLEGADARQASYAQRFRDFEYTPEMVIDGNVEVVGSNRIAANLAIDRAKHNANTAAFVSATRDGARVSVTIGTGVGSARIVLIGYDARHITPVGRGENGGQTLTESNVVREFAPIGRWSGAALTINTNSVAGDHMAVLLEASDGTIVGASRVTELSAGTAH